MRCMKFSAAKRTRTSSARAATGGRGGSNNKKQPSDPSSTNSHPPTLPPLTPPLTRHQHQLQLQQQQQQQRGVVNRTHSHTNSSSTGTILNSIGPKPSQSESRMPGRHPHPPTGNNSKLKHKCPFDGCPWRFATPYKLRRHIKSHTKETPFLCKECGRGFSVRYNLLMHIQTIHSQPQKYKCPMKGCKEAFHTQPRLNGHLRRVHKKDWKTLPKTEVDAKQGGGGGGSRSSSTSSDDSVEAAPKSPTFECSQCSSVFPSQAKLNTHLKSHAPNKSFKCTLQGCSKTFPTKEKLTKHLEVHKQPKQFCCPHQNCNRVFLRQSHLKNHLKIHTQDSFVCPVMDCNQKFGSEADYNVHLNSHMNYGHKCQVTGCGHAFSTRKRLELHCRVMHGLELNGHQPLLPGPLGHAPALIPPSQHSPPHPHTLTNTCPLTHDGLANVEEGLREVDLPGLSADEIETILSENSNWSGEQFKNFFYSAVELSEIEAKLFSGSGYESDSGYSTVSPITSSAPIQFGGCRPAASTSYRSISPALTPVNPSPYISLSSSNPFQFGHTSMHMSLHSSGPATTPLPHSASPDADFTFFPQTPSYPSSIAPPQDTYMLQGAPHSAFPIQPTPQYPREYQPPPYVAVLPDLRHVHQQEAYGIEFTDILASSPSTKDCMPSQCSGSVQRRRVTSLPLLPNDIKPQMEECKHAVCSTPPPSSTPAQVPTAPTSGPPFIKLEPSFEESPCNNTTPSLCKMSANPPKTSLDTPALQESPTNSSQLQPFLAACSQLPSLQELVSSGVHPSVVVVTVSTVLSAPANQTNGSNEEVKQKLTVQKGPYDVQQLLSQITNLTPSQSEKLADPSLISAAKLVATKHLESLAAERRKGNAKQAHSATPATASTKPAERAASKVTSIKVESKTSYKPCITVKAFSKTQQSQLKPSSSVSRVGAGSHMKNNHKKTQWPRSMKKANLIAFREHILNKLKRGQEDSQRLNPQEVSAGNMSGVSSSFEMNGEDLPARCSSEPANFFSHRNHADSPSPLQSSHSAGDIKSLQLKHYPSESETDNMHPDFNPDILLSSSVLGLPGTLLADMEIDSLSSISSPSKDDFAQFLCDPSPPSSVTSPIDSMEELNSLQNFLGSENSISPPHINEVSSPSSSPHTSSFSPTTTTAITQQSSFTTNPAGETTTCSMADVASLFNESINSIANVESVAEGATVVLEDSLESVFQRPTDPLLACGSRLHW